MRKLPILLTLLLLGCARRDGVTDGSPGELALSVRGVTPARAVERGFREANAYCQERGQKFEFRRSTIGAADYQIAFRCSGPATPRVAVAAPPASGNAATAETAGSATATANPYAAWIASSAPAAPGFALSTPPALR